jgi:hypothetical protein
MGGVNARTQYAHDYKGVLAGEFDAAFVDLPHNLRALREGAREIVVRPMPMSAASH